MLNNDFIGQLVDHVNGLVKLVEVEIVSRIETHLSKRKKKLKHLQPPDGAGIDNLPIKGHIETVVCQCVL